jgi:hypothetical protein
MALPISKLPSLHTGLNQEFDAAVKDRALLGLGNLLSLEVIEWHGKDAGSGVALRVEWVD